MPKKAIVIGAGIVGLAAARALAVREYGVTVIERNNKAIGASIRNFGMIWPIGQPDGELYERAMLSKTIWKLVCEVAGIWYDQPGSLHLACAHDEWLVMQQFAEATQKIRGCELLSPGETLKKSPSIVKDRLVGSLFSKNEMIVDPREAIERIPLYFTEKYGVKFLWGKTVTEVCYPSVSIGKEKMEADEIYVCSGADFETLYPEIYSEAPITKCKLQMMKIAAQPNRIGPALCGALSLIHYSSFKAAFALNELKRRFENDYCDYLKWGIHVMVSQNRIGELTIGDSHEYGLTHDPFDKQIINHMILDYLKTFARFKIETVIETWNGIYPKLTNGQTDLIFEPEPGVTIITGLGGAGMTLAFGLCEQLLRDKHTVSLSAHDKMKDTW